MSDLHRLANYKDRCGAVYVKGRLRFRRASQLGLEFEMFSGLNFSRAIGMFKTWEVQPLNLYVA